MHRALKGVLWAVVGLIVAVVAAFAWGRLRPPTPEQAKALAALEADSKPPQGRNAYPWLWFVDFDVPADQLDAAYAKDRQRVLAWEATVEVSHRSTSTPNPQADFPPLPKLTQADRDILCLPREADCLSKVRAHIQEVQQVLARHPQRLQRDVALGQFDLAWSDMPAGPLAPIPSFIASMGLWQTAIAASYLDGRQAQALDAACTQVAAMRRLHAHSNTLIGTMVFSMRLRGGVQLFAQLLADTPVDATLPPSCAEAFSPVTDDDVDLCPSIRFEFARVASPELFTKPEHWYENFSLSAPLSRRAMAVNYGAVCDAELRKRLLADEHVHVVSKAPDFDMFDVVSNSVGTVLSRIATPSFEQYLARQQDLAASLRMGALLLWLRETHDQGMPLQQRLATRPAWMHFADDRHVDVTSDGKALTMDLRDRQARDPWLTTWPLAPGL